MRSPPAGRCSHDILRPACVRSQQRSKSSRRRMWARAGFAETTWSGTGTGVPCGGRTDGAFHHRGRAADRLDRRPREETIMSITLRRAALAGVVVAGTLAATALPASADAGTLFSPNPAPGWGQDGTAYAVAIAGDTVFAGGSFGNAVRNLQLAPRVNLMAVQRSSPVNLLPFAPTTNGTVRAMATDGSALYIGGDFTLVNDQPRNHLAKLDFAGNLDAQFNVDVPKTVRDLLVVGDTLYLVGDFGKIGSQVRKYAGAVNRNTGAVLGFNPNLGGKAYAVAASGSTVYLGGN